MNKKIKTKNNKRTLVISGALLVVALLVAGLIYHNSKSGSDATAATDGVNLSPASEDEIADSNQSKQDIVDQDTAPTSPNDTQKTVEPSIINAGQSGDDIQVRAFIPGVFESGGTCTFTFTDGAHTITKTVTATQDATTTRCPNVAVAKSEFAASSKWSVVVSYSSSKYKGSSDKTTFEVK